MRKHRTLSLLLVVIILLMTGCQINTLALNPVQKIQVEPKETPNYRMKMLVVYGDDGYLPLYQQLKQSLVVGLQVDSIPLESVTGTNLKAYDIVYLSSMDAKIKGLKGNQSSIYEYVEQGGRLILSQEILAAFPSSFTGLEHQVKLVDINQQNLSYPEVGGDLKGVQKIAQAFEKDYRKHINKELKVQTAKVKGAEVVIGYKDQALVSINQYESGKVIVLSDFLPNYNQYITGFDLVERKEENNYFQFFYATANYQMLNELMSYFSKDQYGMSFKKVLGTYGRPAMAWQNHYEVLDSIKNKELITWIDILKKHNQIPSISLVRGSYDWGEWYNTITYHINVGSNNKPKFMGEEENSYYSNGVYIKDTKDQDITLEKYPELVSYYSKVDRNFRPYPYFIDWNKDSQMDIIVGNHNGTIAIMENAGTKEAPRFKEPTTLKDSKGKDINLGENAAPTVVDFDGNGLNDLIVGNKAGKVYLLINTEKGILSPQALKTAKGKEIKVSGEAAPFVGDLTGDGTMDLVVGDQSGKVYFYEGIKAQGQKLKFTEGREVSIKGQSLIVNKFASPHIGDYNGDGKMDLLVGDANGDIHINLNTETETTKTNGELPLSYKGKAAAERKNIYGKNTIYTGKNVVPFLLDWDEDGRMDLMTGQLSFSRTYDLSLNNFPYKNELEENLKYAQQQHVPIFPHIYFHSHKDDALEKREIELHQENFKRLGLPWGYTGTNQHTWRVNVDDPTQSFRNLMEYGIWNNFGFKTPNAPTDPNFGRDYIWSTPFIMMEGEEFLPMVLFTPSPFIRNYGEVYDHLADMDTPFTFFEHIEYKITRGGSGLQHLMQMIDFSNEVREKYNYAFMTEEQMAMAFINTFYTDYEITIGDKQVQITPNIENVPQHLAAEYIGTGGIGIELGEKLKGNKITADALIQYRQEDRLYIGVGGAVKLDMTSNKFSAVSKPPISILMVNGPIEYQWEGNELIIKFKSKGLNQIMLSSENTLEVKGEEIKVEEQDRIYTVTHYGENLEMRVNPKK
ncbi:FG-GAP repeat domain-containing protein [Alkaliphilus hydrothermalis]|uniref:FG-GAP repeat protein n=1 Tax=Alkaliphilus hydrothermalis TaxID=1482730 RepID=A0ABS2NQ49_9FIRM|nr:VCBS repeat-containing protein [Alkaliphilus hydrothermalis]MBM7615058.1 hypothetical protein [Alkaliphilus hydrothermalis]